VEPVGGDVGVVVAYEKGSESGGEQEGSDEEKAGGVNVHVRLAALEDGQDGLLLRTGEDDSKGTQLG
jgi:hypothetical protein